MAANSKVEDGLLDVLADPVGVRVAWAGDPVEQTVGAVGLEVAPDLIELLAAVADDAAGLAHIAELAGKLEQSELSPCYLLLRGHVVLRSRLDVLHNTILTPAGSGMATPGVAALGASGPSLRDTRCGAICQVNTVSVHYNDHRPHFALNWAVPVEGFQPSPRAFKQGGEPVDYAAGDIV